MTKIKVACIQMTSGPDIQGNLDAAGKLIREAAKQGATFVATPENTDSMVFPAKKKVDITPSQDAHPAIPFFSNLAKELNITLLVGSIAVKLPNGKLANRSFLFSPAGQEIAYYDKIHMFDVDLPTGESHRESENIEPGTNAVVADTSFAKLGLSVCYDLRFAYLYRKLAQSGAQILTIPAAFTVPTGKAHWEVLLRARAIETGSFVIAPAQTGEHEGGRKTYGHALIVSPWGDVLADAGEKPGVIVVEINLEDVARARNAIPALQHDRLPVLL